MPTSGLERIVKPKTRQELVLDQLREAILDGVLKPGEKLQQTELASILGVSRMPVREALRSLEAEGLVIFYPHRGAFVSELSPDELEQICLLREAAESRAARLGARAVGPDDLAQMGQILGEMGEPDVESDDWVALNDAFHMILYRASGLSRLCWIIELLRHNAQPYVRDRLIVPERVEVAGHEHEELLSACRNGDGDEAEEIVSRHLARVIEHWRADHTG